jgi:hypothetical protein
MLLFVLTVNQLVCDYFPTTFKIVSTTTYVDLHCTLCDLPCTGDQFAPEMCPRCTLPVPTPYATCKSQPTPCVCPTFPPVPTPCIYPAFPPSPTIAPTPIVTCSVYQPTNASHNNLFKFTMFVLFCCFFELLLVTYNYFHHLE